MNQGDSQTRLYVSGARPAALPETGQATPESVPPWWERPYGRWRLSVERDAMSRFPGFKLIGSPSGPGWLCWLGTLQTSFDPENSYVVRVNYPPGFPAEAPGVVIERPELREGTPHVLGPRRPCLYHPSQDSRNGYDPGRTTAATLVAWTALWLHAYETWSRTGRWPGRGD